MEAAGVGGSRASVWREAELPRPPAGDAPSRRVARLAFFTPNSAFLAYFYCVWQENLLFGIFQNLAYFLAFFSPLI